MCHLGTTRGICCYAMGAMKDITCPAELESAEREMVLSVLRVGAAEANRRRLSGVSTTTTTRTRRDGSTSRAARMARALDPTRVLTLDWVCWKRWSIEPMTTCDGSTWENVLLASASSEDPTHREIRLVRERRHANRMRNGEVRLTGGGGIDRV